MATAHLKRSSTGHLLHGPNGHLVRDCGHVGCGCADSLLCANCSDATPTRFHVSFFGVTLCPGCIPCSDAGLSLQINAGSVLDGTYVMTHNGACAWTTFSTSVPCSATLFFSDDCTGESQPIAFAIQQIRINSHQFRLQVTDDTNTILLFDAVVESADCCAGFTVINALTACGCTVGETVPVAGATGGFATVTPC